ncbi:unnamed protein product [Vitrella brassicaformis CCMP3155]|uniref:Protein kinase domain-containing protein n=1 Tax=Vitrella brassicaformis (strain CCMP3155) TaxID=1169540 RepID=A0A0G4GXX0_VITBC|nr:unnamed protein product [Vitrella brassicaformis CCMP3155]|eukprot:CEM35952.1 unnamed protein product [Vitrella brassicaformis CCMP3155]
MGQLGRLEKLAEQLDLSSTPVPFEMATGPVFIEDIPLRHLEWDDTMAVGCGSLDLVESAMLRKHQRVARIDVFVFTQRSASGPRQLGGLQFPERSCSLQNALIREADEILKLADFGMAESCAVNRFEIRNPPDPRAGTFNYMAPEIFTNGRISQKTDIWALGCSLIEIFGGEEPWVYECWDGYTWDYDRHYHYLIRQRRLPWVSRNWPRIVRHIIDDRCLRFISVGGLEQGRLLAEGGDSPPEEEECR